MISYIKNLFKGKADEDETPRRFLTSDLHIGHENVISYCDRPYMNKEKMNEDIVQTWNEKVRPQDIVYVLGDFSLSPRYLEEIGLRLNGTKHLITGNHDKCFGFKTNAKAAKIVDRYLTVFATVKDSDTLTLKDGRTVLLSHFPYQSKEGGKHDQRYWQQRPKDKGMVLLHGHIHGAYIKDGRMIDVGYDGKLDLWSEDEVIELINDERKFIPSRITEWRKENNRNKESKNEDY